MNDFGALLASLLKNPTQAQQSDCLSRDASHSADSVDPFALLGLTRPRSQRRPTQEQVTEALHAQLRKLDAHPQAGSIAAERVRAALHIAAAQVRDPVTLAYFSHVDASHADRALTSALVRAVALGGGWTPKATRYLIATAGAEAITPARIERAQQLLRHQRGLNWVSPPQEVAAKAKDEAAQDARAAAELDHTALGSTAPVMRDHSKRLLNTLSATFFAGSVVVAVMIGLIIQSGNGFGTQQRNSHAAAVPNTIAHPPDGPSRPSQSSAAVVTFTERVQHIEQAYARNDAQARPMLRQLAQQLSAQWVNTPTSQLNALHASFVQALVDDLALQHRNSSATGEDNQPVLHDVLAFAGPLTTGERPTNAQDIAPAVWSCGVIGRLSHRALAQTPTPGQARHARGQLLAHADGVEQITPTQIDTYAREQPTSFVQAANAATVLIGQTLLREPDPYTSEPGKARAVWQAIFETANHLQSGSQSTSTTATALLHYQLKYGPSAAQHRTAHALLETLAQSIKFNQTGGAAGQTIVDACRDIDVGTETLGLFVQQSEQLRDAVAFNLGWSYGARQGACAELAVAVDPELRQLVEDGTSDQQGGDLSQQRSAHSISRLPSWAKPAAALLEQSPRGKTDRQQLVLAARLATASSAIAAGWSGNERLAIRSAQRIEKLNYTSLLDISDQEMAFSGIAPRLLTSPGQRPDGRWVQRLQNAGNNTASALTTIEELRLDGPIGPADGDVLTLLALRNSPRQIAYAARSVASAHTNNPYVVYGFLESLYNAPRNQLAVDTLSVITARELPEVSEARWRPYAHRALAEHLLSLVAVPTDEARALDGASQHFATTAHHAHDAISPAAATAEPASAVNQASMQPDVSYALVASALRGQIDSKPQGPWMTQTTADLRRRSAARQAIAQGPMQRFVAQQSSVAEAIALRIALEQPSLQTAAEHVLQEMNTMRTTGDSGARSAGHGVLGQILHGERAIAKLWLLAVTADETIIQTANSYTPDAGGTP